MPTASSPAPPAPSQSDHRSDYDLWHQRIYDASPEHDDASSPWYQLVREYLGDVSGLRVLEVAGSRVGFVRSLARAGARVTGCDFSAAALRADAAKNSLVALPAPAFIQGDAQNLPFAANSFDLLVSCETIEHLPRVQSAVNEMYRVAGPGAGLLLTTSNYANFMGLYELYARFRDPSRKDDQPFDRCQSFLQVRSWVRRAGWRILRTDGTVHQFPFRPRHNPVRWLALESNRSLCKLLSPFSFTYFVLAVKPA